MILQSRLCKGLPAFSEDELKAYAAAWAVPLAKIPTDQLFAVYEVAIESHTKDSPFGTANVLSAWESMQFRRWLNGEAFTADTPACNVCGDTGWREVVTYDVNGNRNTASTKCNHN